MNVSEAVATNILLRAVLAMPAGRGAPVGEEEVERAARFLAGRAYRALGGGLDGEAVALRWAKRFRPLTPLCERCGQGRAVPGSCEGCGEELCVQCWGDPDNLLCGACRHRRRPAYEDVRVTSGVL
jgi:hypothetical protein